MVPSEKSLCFLVPLVGDEPAGRLGQEPDNKDNDKRRNRLKYQRKAPRKIRVDLLGAQCDTSSGDGTAEPAGDSQERDRVNNVGNQDIADTLPAIIECSHTTAPLRRGHLDNVRRGRAGQHADTETQDEPTPNKLSLRLRGSDYSRA